MNLEGRKIVFIILFIFVGIVFVIRLFYMQVVDDEWIKRAGEVAKRKITIKPPRGIIYDRAGKIVVGNRTYYDLMFVEDNIKDLDTVAFAKLVGIPVDSVAARFASIKRSLDRKTKSKTTGNDTIVNDYRSYLPYAFLKELTKDEMEEIAVDLPNFKGFYEIPISLRYYPYHCGANIFGYLNEVNYKELKADPNFYNVGDLIGRSGLERYYEKILRGKKGTKVVLTSARGKEIDDFAGGKLDTLAKQGPALHLGLDIELQKYGQKLMQNKLGAIVAIEPSTGQILAMVSAPSYDPNLLVGEKKLKENYVRIHNDSLKPFYPRAIASTEPPGSTFKTVQSAIGMQEGVFDSTSSFHCNKAIVHCHNHPDAQNISQAIMYSCNPYFYQAVRRIIEQHYYTSRFKDAAKGLALWDKYMHSFGLGIKLKTDIYGVEAGRIPTPAFYNRWYGKYRWAFSTIQSISIGQGEVTLTPLQLANIAAIIANKGYYYIPHFVSSIGNQGPLPQYKVRHYTMVDSSYFNPIKKGMRMVVNHPGGTARRARLDSIIVCGKTGTAQNPHGKDHSVFIAFAPYDHPKIAISVFVQNAGFGGVWAAPIASLMIEKYLRDTITTKFKEQRILDKDFIHEK
ncbi:MAG TPA: penicillin-binding transpeptidase domain-containing protein [Arachidicoccus soli]|nr:penicillin-binding transpeptidase domain-containing protein [Arachidicoccus soli]